MTEQATSLLCQDDSHLRQQYSGLKDRSKMDMACNLLTLMTLFGNCRNLSALGVRLPYLEGNGRRHYLLGYDRASSVEWYLDFDFPDVRSFIDGFDAETQFCRILAWEALMRCRKSLTELAFDDDSAHRRDTGYRSCDEQTLLNRCDLSALKKLRLTTTGQAAGRCFLNDRLFDCAQSIEELTVGSRTLGPPLIIHPWLPALSSLTFGALKKLRLFKCNVALGALRSVFRNAAVLTDVKLCDLCLIHEQVSWEDIHPIPSLWPLVFAAMRWRDLENAELLVLRDEVPNSGARRYLIDRFRAECAEAYVVGQGSWCARLQEHFRLKIDPAFIQFRDADGPAYS